MIENFVDNFNPAPFYYEQIDSVLISESPIVVDLFFLEEVNGLVLKNFSPFSQVPKEAIQQLVEIENSKDLLKLADYGLNERFCSLLLELLTGLNSSLLGVQVTKPMQEMCPSFHVDKLPLRIVQCLDGPGTTLLTTQGKIIETEESDLILLKGEMWKSKVGALKHKSPNSHDLRRLLRIDFLD